MRIMVPIPSWLGMLRANVIMRTLVDWWRGNNMPGVKRKVLHSIIRFWFYALYLFVIFGMLALHEVVVSAKDHIDYHFYGFAIFNALIFGKVMLVADELHFANWFKDHPLIYSIICKAVAFTVLFLVFDVVEEVVLGAFKGRTIAESIPHIGGSPLGLLYIMIIISVALIPFFAFREIGRVIGEQHLREMLFTKDYSWQSELNQGTLDPRSRQGVSGAA
jgi:hypothetical protein